MAKSIIGFHYSVDGDKRGTREFMETLNRNGIPFLVKGAGDTGLIAQAQEYGNKYGVKNWMIHRSIKEEFEGHAYEVPDYNISPLEAAEKYWNKAQGKWPTNLDPSEVWMEPLNEIRGKKNPGDTQFNNMHPVDWLGEFMYEFAQIANRNGFKVCGPSFNSGEPGDEGKGVEDTLTQYSHPGMIKYLRYCAENPEKAALAVHEYSWDYWKKGQSWSDWYPTLFGRVEAAIAAADNHGIPRNFHIFVTEWGFALGEAPYWEQAKPHLDDYNRWAARFPQMKGVAAWSLQTYHGLPIDSFLVTWIDKDKADNLQNYAAGAEFPMGEQPARTHELFGGTLPGEPSKPTEHVETTAPVEPTHEEPDDTPVVSTVEKPADVPTMQELDSQGFVDAMYGLNMRSEPGTRGGQATIVQFLENNTHVIIQGITPDLDPNSSRQWLKVQAGDKVGYVAAQFVRTSA